MTTHSFKELFEEELKALGLGVKDQATKNREPKVASNVEEPYVTFVADDLSGIALSGGGIRSATFNLGLLQGLFDLGILKHFQYLSTVSGGGYIGGW